MKVSFSNRGRLSFIAESTEEKKILQQLSDSQDSGVRIFASMIVGISEDGVDHLSMDLLPFTQRTAKEIFGIRLSFHKHIKQK